MGVAPHLRPLDARHGGGMLPQIEVVPPLGGCGKRAAGDLHFQFEPLLVAVAGDRHRRAVESGRGILRHVDGDPYRTHRAGFERHRRPIVEHVGSQHRREILRLALAAAAGEFVAHHVAHETGAHRTFGQPPFIGGQHPCRAVIRRAAAVFPTCNFLLPFFRCSDAPGRQRNAQSHNHRNRTFFDDVLHAGLSPCSCSSSCRSRSDRLRVCAWRRICSIKSLRRWLACSMRRR